jgi:hypothetical protein
MQSIIHLAQVLSILAFMHYSLVWIVKTFIPADQY